MISYLVKGEAPTLLEADKGNQLIGLLNALANMKVVRGSKDGFDINYNGATLTIAEDDTSETDDEEEPDHTHEEQTITLYVCENGIPVQKNFVVR